MPDPFMTHRPKGVEWMPNAILAYTDCPMIAAYGFSLVNGDIEDDDVPFGTR
jgi:hypothetical protein